MSKICAGEIKYITPLEAGYPSLLREIPNPPAMLYYIGNLSLAESFCVSVVGARKATAYGKWVAKKIGGRLGECGVTVVSGLAAGIDGCSHKGALEAGGSTIAVMGNGLDICYPDIHENLMREVGAKGLLLSEYAPGTSPGLHTFPMRNRIISGLSVATVVVEAGLKSGSLITAERAAEQGRDVYAVPGNINSYASMGTNKLIREGALPLVVIDDILEDLGVVNPGTEKVFPPLGREEESFVKLLCETGEITVDELCVKLEVPPGKAMGILTVLEMKGVVHYELGKVFIAK